MNILKQMHSSQDPATNSSEMRLDIEKKQRLRLFRASYRSSQERMKKNRKALNGHLRRMGTVFGKNLSLNADGMCYFQYNKFIVCIEVPKDQGGIFYVYTMVCRIEHRDNKAAVMQRAMELNYMQAGTRGACLGLEEEEVNLCFSAPVCGLGKEDLFGCVEDFLHTAEEMNSALEAAKRLPSVARSALCS